MFLDRLSLFFVWLSFCGQIEIVLFISAMTFLFLFLFQAEKSGTVMFAEEMLELNEENADKRGGEGDDVLAEFSGI